MLRWQYQLLKGAPGQDFVGFEREDKEHKIEGIALKNWKTLELFIEPSGIDLTMKIAGNVFLDRDTGKVNTGDSIMQNNELLQGVEVVLYDAETNQVVNKTNSLTKIHAHGANCYADIEHVHTGDPYTGGGCYTERIHTHEKNGLIGGACYKEVPYKPQDITIKVPIYHHHGDGYCDQSGGEFHRHTSVYDGIKEEDACYKVRNMAPEPGVVGYGTCKNGHTYQILQWFCTVKGCGGYGRIETYCCDDHPRQLVDGQEPICNHLVLTCGKEAGSVNTNPSHEHTKDCIVGCDGKWNAIGGTHWKHICRKCGQYFQNSMTEAMGYPHDDKDLTVERVEREKMNVIWADMSTEKYGTECKYHGGSFDSNLEWGSHWYSDGADGTCGLPVYKCGSCSKNEGVIVGYEEKVISSTDQFTYFELNCDKPLWDIKRTPDGKPNCNDNGGRVLTCGKSGQVEGTETTTLLNPVITNEKGYYEFAGLDAMKKYYVKFVYNGIVYTNVEKTFASGFNGDNDSKADETSRYNYRTPFNLKFAEIGSYPANYKIVNKVFGNELGEYNKTYQQEDIIDIFKEISNRMVGTNMDNCISSGACLRTYDVLRRNPKYAETSPEELKRMIQFAADCRIQSQTVKNYPLTQQFTISGEGTIKYPSIYSGKYNQLHVNLGIKARPTFDLALYKDVLKAEVSINGKTETYNYNSKKQSSAFKIGVSEDEYLKGLRGKYQSNIDYTNGKKTSGIEADSYNLGMREEEVKNGQNAPYNYGLTGEDRLKIKVTYKIAIKNQSSTIGAVTEIVDYYDLNYKFVDAYVGDEFGNKTGDVTTSNNSKYVSPGYKSTKNAYNTIYLRPNIETKLDNEDQQYIYVVFELVGPSGDVSTLLANKLNDNSTLNAMNLAEINGYKTYNKTDNGTPGLIDIDSTPGNFNISNIDALTQEKIVAYPNIRAMYEDDTNRAPAMVYKKVDSRTIEGTVFEDASGSIKEVNGKLDEGETGINGVIVELVEVKNNNMIVRAETKTNENGKYNFTGFIPGDYVVRYTYGLNNETALAKSSPFDKGLNDKSYNGQDYQATTYTVKADKTEIQPNTDSNLINRYVENNNAKNSEESIVQITDKITLDKHPTYWYTVQDGKSDAKDYEYRTSQISKYANEEYGRGITNYKAEVFNSYVNPQPEHLNNVDTNRKLVSELERRTYRFAYTPVLEVEVEYATKVTDKTTENKLTGIDFGIVEREKSELVLDQDIKHIKVTLSDGKTVLFDTKTGTDNLQWIKGAHWKNGIQGKALLDKWAGLDVYDKKELINIIMDEELINGATLEITYGLTLTNNSKEGTGTTRAKNILNYVANNLNFDVKDNGNLWKVVKKDEVQTGERATFVNNHEVDLSTQGTILQTTEENPLVKTSLAPGQQVSAELKLKKVLATESSIDDLTYTNMAEIVEIENTVGRYDRGAIPGNQKLDKQPQEHDTAGASSNTSFDIFGQPDDDHPQDGTIVVTPPTGSTYIYYVIGIASSLILIAGIFLIKKFVINSKK